MPSPSHPGSDGPDPEQDQELDDSFDGGDDLDDLDDADDGDVDEDGADANLNQPRPGLLTMLQDLGLRLPRSSKPAGAPLSEAEKERAIRNVDPTERKLGYGAAALMAVAGLFALVPHIEHPNRPVVVTATKTKGKCPSDYTEVAKVCTQYVVHSRSDWILSLAVVLVLAVLVAVATRWGRRSLLAFALLFGGLAVETLTYPDLGLLFLIGGGWLLVRSYRVQKYGTTSSREVAKIAAERRSDKRKGITPAPTKASAKGAKAKGKAAPTPGERPKPGANKRYTPKAPPRKKPVPPAS